MMALNSNGYLNGIEIPEQSSGSELHFSLLNNEQWIKAKESMRNEVEQQNKIKSNNEQNKWTTITNNEAQ